MYTLYNKRFVNRKDIEMHLSRSTVYYREKKSVQSRANSLQYALQYVLEGKKYTEVLSEYACAFVHRNRMTEDPQGLPTLLSIR